MKLMSYFGSNHQLNSIYFQVKKTNHYISLQALFLAKCPVHLKDKWGLTAADVATVYGHRECALFLRQ